MKKLLARLLTLYLIASACVSTAYNVSRAPWNIAECRNGLLCVGVTRNTLYILSPFCNHSDVFLFGVGCDQDGFYTYSDGLHHLCEF